MDVFKGYSFIPYRLMPEPYTDIQHIRVPDNSGIPYRLASDYANALQTLCITSARNLLARYQQFKAARGVRDLEFRTGILNRSRFT